MEKFFKKNQNLLFLVIILITFGVIFSPFLNVIGASIVSAYFAYPLFQKLRKKMSESIAITISWLVIFSIILIPLTIVATITFYQAKIFVKQTLNYVNGPNIEKDINRIIENNTFLKEYISTSFLEEYVVPTAQSGSTKFTEIPWIYEWYREESINGSESIINKYGISIFKFIGGVIKEIPLSALKLILYTFLTSSLLVYGATIHEIIKRIIPLDNAIFDRYTEKIKQTTDGIMKWNFIVAAIQAVVTTISFWAVGIPYLGIIFLLSFILYIPMIGTLIFYLPATIYIFIQGKYIIAILFFLCNSLIIANIDNVMRWRFIPKETQVNNTLIFLSILSGMILFGFIGILYGPLIIVIGVTTVQMYLETQKWWKEIIKELEK